MSVARVVSPAEATPPRRRDVIEQVAAPLIPLRPLTIGEAMDAAFLIVRRNARDMFGLPALVAAAMAVYTAASAGLTWLAGESTFWAAPMLVGAGTAFIGSLLFAMILYWIQAMMTRVCLRTVMGEPLQAPVRRTWRQSLRFVGPMLAVLLVHYLYFGVISSAGSLVGFFVMMGLSQLASALGAVGTLILVLLAELATLFATVWAYAWVAPIVPIYVAEGPNADPWLGLPRKRTSIFPAVVRSFVLVGWRDSLRIALALLATILGVLIVAGLVTIGVSLLAMLYLQSLQLPPQLNPTMVLLGGYAVVTVLTATICLAYFSALQTIFYLDLRMRREGLDLALRFRVVPVPEPNQLGVF